MEGAERVATTLRLGDRLDAAVEHEDKVNARARKLSFQGQPVGYAPDYLVGDLDQLERAAPTPSFTVARVNPPPAPAHHRVLVRVEAAWPSGFAPFAGPQFERVVASPLALAG